MKITYIEKFGKIFSEYTRVKLAYLFGSFIKSQFFNDIDIGIVLEDEKEAYEDLKFGLKIGRILEKSINFKYPIDVKILNHAPIYFQYNVIKTGEVIFSKNEDIRIDYEKKLMGLFLEYQEMYSWFQIQILERG